MRKHSVKHSVDFKEPTETKKPSNNVSCPDVLPLQYSEHPSNSAAMNSLDPLDHPDSTDTTRYCLGTRIQMRSNGKGSHKAKECLYHSYI